MSIVCVKHRYIDQMGTTPCPECREEEWLTHEPEHYPLGEEE